MRILRPLCFLSLLAVTIAACGGGGSSNDGPPATTPGNDAGVVGNPSDAPLDAGSQSDASEPGDAGENANDASVMCEDGGAACSGACVDLATDSTHCGSCAMACPNAATCSAGMCQLNCAAGFVNDGAECVPETLVERLSVRDELSCAVHTDGTVVCWGDNSDSATPPAGTFRQVSANETFACGVTTGGSVVCWGNNAKGQTTTPKGIFRQVSAGTYHACGVKTDGSVVCWGDPFGGGATPPEGTFRQVSAGEDFTCGLKVDGTVACWGTNGFGQTTAVRSDRSQRARRERAE
jgi:alpha-tubulin suppressor-like RCC1 family protein